MESERPGFRSLLSELVFSSVKWAHFTNSTIFKVSLATLVFFNFKLHLAGPRLSLSSWGIGHDQGQ